jgi:acyl-CoA synthetase (AMP-forming)/AMP-acid ligase II
VALADLNSEAVPIVLFAAAPAGKPFVPMNYRLTHEQLRAIVARTAPATVIVGEGIARRTAMAEAFNSLYKWELIYPQAPWKALDDVEFATLGYIDWFNHRRLHGEITDDNTYVTPAEFEATYYRQSQAATEALTQ